MRERILILGGVAIFLVLFTYPVVACSSCLHPGKAPAIGASGRRPRVCCSNSILCDRRTCSC